MQLNSLLDEAYTKSRETLDDGKFETEEERREAADRIAIASIKFGDLINNRAKDYIFDIDRFLSCEGKTGAYLLYTITRITSLLKKVEGEIPTVCDVNCEITSSERELLLNLLDSAEYFASAVTERAPNYVAESAYKIATAFSVFYHDNRVLGEENATIRANRIALCNITKARLTALTDLLGITTVDAM